MMGISGQNSEDFWKSDRNVDSKSQVYQVLDGGGGCIGNWTIGHA